MWLWYAVIQVWQRFVNIQKDVNYIDVAYLIKVCNSGYVHTRIACPFPQWTLAQGKPVDTAMFGFWYRTFCDLLHKGIRVWQGAPPCITVSGVYLWSYWGPLQQTELLTCYWNRVDTVETNNTSSADMNLYNCQFSFNPLKPVYVLPALTIADFAFYAKKFIYGFCSILKVNRD